MSFALEILYCDNHLLAVAKPAGVPVAPDASGDPALLDQAREWVRRELEKPGRAWLGLVHRLDRPVSGVVVLARTSKAAARLSEQFRVRTIEKLYLGVVQGAPAEEAGELAQWLRKDPTRNRVSAVAPGTPDALEARTRWRVLRTEAGRALLELAPLTGRPHQLRAACASLGTPLLGDLKYGAPEALQDRSIALHARQLALDHPTRPERMRFCAAPPVAGWWRIAHGR